MTSYPYGAWPFCQKPRSACDCIPRFTLRESSSLYRSLNHARIGRMSLVNDLSPASGSVSETTVMLASSSVASARRQSNMLRATREMAHT